MLEQIVRDAGVSLKTPGKPPSPGFATLFDAGPEETYITFAKARIFVLNAHALNDKLNDVAVRRLGELVEEFRYEVPGVNVGIMICNDRRWPEAWRVMGLQGVELVMVGYNTPSTNTSAVGFEAPHLRVFHSHLSVQAGAYQNATFAAAVAKGGNEDGHELFGHSIIVNPQGEIIAQAASWDDELIVADCNLDMCTLGRTTVFAFDRHRRPEAYTRITTQVGATEPPIWSKPLIEGPGRRN